MQDILHTSPSIIHGEILENVKYHNLQELLTTKVGHSPTTEFVFIQNDEQIAIDMETLYIKALRICAGLEAFGISKNAHVLIHVNQNDNYIIAFWGCILGGYIPVPISGGSDLSLLHKVNQLLQNPFLITDEQQNKGDNDNKVLFIDELLKNDTSRGVYLSDEDEIAVLLFTSGSTGLPKGVALTHRNIISAIHGMAHHHNMTAKDVLLNWMPLQHAAGLIMMHLLAMHAEMKQVHVDKEVIIQEPVKWLQLIHDFRATYTWAPNFAFALLNNELEGNPPPLKLDLRSVRIMLNGGEQVDVTLCEKLLKKLSAFHMDSSVIYPAWGMSETCSGVIYNHGFDPLHTPNQSYYCQDADDGRVAKIAQIGKPIPNMSIRIVNRDNEVVGESEVGFVQVRGDCLFKGYFGNEALNKEVFTEDGWFDTGDLGLIANGNLVLTGRNNDTIIINGLNYNAKEIEHFANGLLEVNPYYTVALGVKNETTSTEDLILFVSDKENSNLDITQIRNFSNQMISKFGISPREIVNLEKEKYPRSILGKIMTKQLRDLYLNGQYHRLTSEFKASKTKVEQILVESCSKLLSIERVSTSDNFLLLGGNSLQAARYISKINKALNIRLTVKQLYDAETFLDLARSIASMESGSHQEIPKIDSTVYRLSDTQYQQFIFHETNPQNLVYNIPYFKRIGKQTDLRRLEEVFNQLVNRHPSLRMCFYTENGIVYQKPLTVNKIVFEYFYGTEDEIDHVVQSFIRPFDLKRPPLIRIGILILQDSDTNLLLIDMHHIIADGSSIGIVYNEITKLLKGETLTPLELSYGDYAEWINANLTNNDKPNDWLQTFEGSQHVINLALDYGRPNKPSFVGDRVNVSLNHSVYSDIKKFMNKHRVTLYTVLFSAFNILLAKYSMQEDIVVGTLFSDRDQEELENIVGNFVRSAPIRSYPQPNKKIGAFMQEVKDAVLLAKENKLPFNMLVESLNGSTGILHSPLFNVFFIFHNIDLGKLIIDDTEAADYDFNPGMAKFDLTVEGCRRSRELT